MTFDLSWDEWSDPSAVARELDRGADHDIVDRFGGLVLSEVITNGTAETLAMVLPRVADVDRFGGGIFDEGRTALWHAVYEGRPDLARLLVEAGADPWRDMMAGWSPGRLALAGPTPDVFGPAPAGVALTADEREYVERAQPVIHQFGVEIRAVGWSIAAVAGVTAREAVERVGGVRVGAAGGVMPATRLLSSRSPEPDDFLGASDVPGGCLVVHQMGFDAQTPRMLRLLSTGTRAYGVYDNMASGRQGAFVVDGVIEGWDLSPSGWPNGDDDSMTVLQSFLAHQCAADGSAIVRACLVVGIHPDSAEAFYGPYAETFRIDHRIDWYGNEP